MQRKTFIRNTSLTALMLPWALDACTTKNAQQASSTAEINLDELTIGDLQNKMKSGELTSIAITLNFILKKIDQVDKMDPPLIP